MTLADDCRIWSAEMHRAASAVEAEGIDSKAALAIVDGNRAIAETLAAAAKRIDALERVADAASVLKAAAMSTARMQLRGIGQQGKLCYLRKAAADVNDALEAAAGGGA